MVSASKAKRDAKRAEGGKEKKPTAKSKAAAAAAAAAENMTPEEAHAAELAKLSLQEDKNGISDRVTTGVLSSLATSRDVKITSVSLVFHGKVLIADSTMELTYGRRYGLLGENGCGKSTLLKAIAAREYPIPELVDIYLLNEPAAASELGALDYVVTEAQNELKRLETLAEDILEKEGPESQVLEDLYEVSFRHIFRWTERVAN